jgi:glycosyltransferase involved in cell wall biosynthesis
MRSSPAIWVVVPSYQEERLIARTLETLPPGIERIVVVDDGSTDGTFRAVSEVPDPRILALRHPRNRGVGAAIATGYESFLRAAGPDAVCVVVAGDGQMDPRDLQALITPIREGRADYVKGNRLLWPEAAELMPIVRRMGTRVLSVLTRFVTGWAHIGDSQCGYTAVTVQALRCLGGESFYPRYGYPNDLLLRMAQAGVRVVDVPVRPVYADERSKLVPWRVAPRILGILGRGWLRRLRSPAPAGVALRTARAGHS